MMDKKKYVHVQVGEELKKELLKEADKKQISLNSYIRMILLNRKK